MSGPVELAVGRLDRRLRGPRRVRRDIVAEIRDGLHDAAAAHEDAGLDPAAAAHRALDEFGDLDAVARELQEELAVRQARRTALTVALAYMPLVFAWDLVWRFAPPEGPATSHGPEHLYRAMDLVQLAAAVVGAGLVIALRRRHIRLRLYDAVALVGVVTPLIVVALGGVMLVDGPVGLAAAWLTPATALLLAVSGGVLTASLLAGARCLRMRSADGR